MSKSVLLAFVLILGAYIFMGYVKKLTPKIAFVKTGVLVDGFLGMKESKSTYDKKIAEWQSNVDTLTNQLNQGITRFELNRGDYKPEKLEEQIQIIEQQKLNLHNYKEAIDQRAKQEYDKAIQGPINQINSFVERYAEIHGYDLVLGTTQEGNILYGNKAVDITNEVLKELNKSYKTGE